MFYFYKTSTLLSGGGKTVPCIMPEERGHDIATMDDWHLAEIKFKLMKL